MEMSFGSVALVATVALVAPLAIGLVGLRLPAIVIEILLGIVIGPQVLGWATADEPVRVLSLFGLAFLLLLAGLEIDFDRLRGRLLRITALGYAVSFGIALAVGFGLPRLTSCARRSSSRSSSRQPDSESSCRSSKMQG